MTEHSITDWVLAVSTVFLTVFTGLLFFFTYRLWQATQGTLKLARDEFIKSHRPRLIVRNVVLKKPSNSGHGYLTATDTPSGQFYVENIGDTEATITGSHAIWFTTKTGLPMQRPYEGGDNNNKVALIQLEPGMSMPGFFDSDRWQWDYPKADGVDPYAHFVMGWVSYKDAAGAGYRMAFCRNWDDQAQRFRPVDDPDYEHG